MSKSSSSKSSGSSGSNSSSGSGSSGVQGRTRVVPVDWGGAIGAVNSSAQNSRARKIEQQNFTPSGREAGANASPLNSNSDLIKAMELAIANQNAQQDKTLSQARDWARTSANAQSIESSRDRNFAASQARQSRDYERSMAASTQPKATVSFSKPLPGTELNPLTGMNPKETLYFREARKEADRDRNDARRLSSMDRNRWIADRSHQTNMAIREQANLRAMKESELAAAVRQSELDANARITSSAFSAFSQNNQPLNAPTWWGNYARS